MRTFGASKLPTETAPAPAPSDPKARTAVLFVNGFNGLGLHTLLQAVRLFGGVMKNFGGPGRSRGAARRI